MCSHRKTTTKLPLACEVKIEKLANDGDGAATVDGKSWYIPYTQSGDIVIASPQKQTKNYIKAEATNFIKYSPHKQKPICSLFGKCGGCKLQHLPKNEYQQWKVRQLINILKRHQISMDKLDESCFLPLATRRRVTFFVDKHYNLSFHYYNSHKPIAISYCPLLKEEINGILSEFQSWLNQYGSLLPSKSQIHMSLLNAIEVTIIANEFIPQTLVKALSKLQNIKSIHRLCWKTNHEPYVIWQKEPLFLNWGDLRVAIAPSSFLQASYEGELFLQRKLIQYTKGAKSAMELFCGLGTFSFIMAQNKCKIEAYDNAPASINAAKLALKELPYLQGQLIFIERDLHRQPLRPNEFKQDLVILDPPRAGAKEAIMQIALSSVKKIIMISCNPKSFARDMEILKKAGFYINQFSLLDQFVYSSHSEIIAEIIRTN